jgi:YfiH family protein
MPRLTTGLLNRLDGVAHGFFTRLGGASAGIYASNNCGFGSADDAARVAANRAACAARLDVAPENLLTVHQVHSPDVVRVDAPWPRDRAPRADAMVTRVPGIALGVLTADCAPILFADPEARVIGAAHAGWKGALGGVAEATVAAMEELGGARGRIVAAIGPAIGRHSYEVGVEFADRFLAADPGNAAYLFPAAAPDKRFFDIKAYLAARLVACDLRDISVLPNDTCAEEYRFFSYRRATRRGEADYGRQLSAIALAG